MMEKEQVIEYLCHYRDLSPPGDSVHALSHVFVNEDGMELVFAAIYLPNYEYISLSKWYWKTKNNFAYTKLCKIPLVNHQQVIVIMKFIALRNNEPHLLTLYQNGNLTIHSSKGALCYSQLIHPHRPLQISFSSPLLTITFEGNIVVISSLRDLENFIYGTLDTPVDFQKYELTSRSQTVCALSFFSRNDPSYPSLVLERLCELFKKKSASDRESAQDEESEQSQSSNQSFRSHSHQESVRRFTEGEEESSPPSFPAHSSITPLPTLTGLSEECSPEQVNAIGIVAFGRVPCATLHWPSVLKQFKEEDLLYDQSMERDKESNATSPFVWNQWLSNLWGGNKKTAAINRSKMSGQNLISIGTREAKLLKWSLKIIDTPRKIIRVVNCPWNPFLTLTTDTFGRISLIDVQSLHILHVWKGYRDAQIGWIKRHENGENLMVFYLARRQLLEIWNYGPNISRAFATVLQENGQLIESIHVTTKKDEDSEQSSTSCEHSPKEGDIYPHKANSSHQIYKPSYSHGYFNPFLFLQNEQTQSVSATSPTSSPTSLSSPTSSSPVSPIAPFSPISTVFFITDSGKLYHINPRNI